MPGPGGIAMGAGALSGRVKSYYEAVRSLNDATAARQPFQAIPAFAAAAAADPDGALLLASSSKATYTKHRGLCSCALTCHRRIPNALLVTVAACNSDPLGPPCLRSGNQASKMSHMRLLGRRW